MNKARSVIRAVMLILFTLNFIACVGTSTSSKQSRSITSNEKLILVNFHSEQTINFEESTQGYTYGGQEWQRPLYIQKSMRQVQRDYQLTKVDEWPIESLDLYCVVYAIDSDESIEVLLERINTDSRVAFAEPLVEFQLMQSDAVPNPKSNQRFLDDPLLDVQHPNTHSMLVNLHNLGTGNDIKVGIIDSGIDTNHPDLLGRIHSKESLIPSNLDPSLEHGTAIAGIIGAAAGNKEGIVGLAPDARIYSYEACGKLNNATICDSFTLAKALEHALGDNIDVLNLSLAGRETPLLRALVQKLLDSGVILIAAENSDPTRNFPAKMPNVIPVGSSIAEKLWFARDEQFSTQAGGGYRFFYGTSMSAAGMTGFSAILTSRYEPKEIIAILESFSLNGCDETLPSLTFTSQHLLNYLCDRDIEVSLTKNEHF